MATGVYGPRFYGSDLDVGVTTLIEGDNTLKQNQGDNGWFDPLGNPIPDTTVTSTDLTPANTSFT